jgi:hypothetical protein
MAHVVIDDPILNSPFAEPTRHFTFDAEGITNEIATGRRPSAHFVPIPRAKKKGKQLQFETEWTQDRIEAKWSARPNTILVDSRQLESDEGMSPEFKKIAEVEIEEFTGEYRARFPYTLNGEEQYCPDFIAHVGGFNLIIEVTGEARKDKAAKVTTARTLWVPAVNNHGGFGRWAFVEVTDPWDAQRTIRAAVQAAGAAAC